MSEESIYEKIEFYCPATGDLVTTEDCFDCHRNQGCDVYATMLDEK